MMPPVRYAVAVCVMLLFAGLAGDLRGAEPATIFNFFGIPQGVNKVRDAVVNRKGNFPGLERKPVLKAITDPANLESDVPAIRVAAEVKKDIDLAPQKIKAIKYLAEVGCSCQEGVKDALLASLDDCTEAVRYEAALAFCHAAGNPCRRCERGSCCAPDVVAKLTDMAQGQDERGCCSEPSARVRQMAAAALRACNRMAPVRETPIRETPVEMPLEAPPALPSEPMPPIPAPLPMTMGSVSGVRSVALIQPIEPKPMPAVKRLEPPRQWIIPEPE